jgi:hypothetical protein
MPGFAFGTILSEIELTEFLWDIPPGWLQSPLEAVVLLLETCATPWFPATYLSQKISVGRHARQL